MAYRLSLRVDGPNVNKSFGAKSRVKLQTVDETLFINVGNCSLHACKNAFCEALKIKDQITIDLHFFFKHWAVRKLYDYRGVSAITEVTSEFSLY